MKRSLLAMTFFLSISSYAELKTASKVEEKQEQELAYEKIKFKCGVFKNENGEERHQYGFATFESPNPDSVAKDSKAWVTEITINISETIDSRKSVTMMPMMPRNRGVIGNEGSITRLADPVYGYTDKNTEYPRYVSSIIKTDEPSFLTLHVSKDETLIARCETTK